MQPLCLLKLRQEDPRNCSQMTRIVLQVKAGSASTLSVMRVGGTVEISDEV